LILNPRAYAAARIASFETIHIKLTLLEVGCKPGIFHVPRRLVSFPEKAKVKTAQAEAYATFSFRPAAN
jgi:hypothetical protein